VLSPTLRRKTLRPERGGTDAEAVGENRNVPELCGDEAWFSYIKSDQLFAFYWHWISKNRTRNGHTGSHRYSLIEEHSQMFMLYSTAVLLIKKICLRLYMQ
jgi:hypothetical protein